MTDRETFVDMLRRAGVYFEDSAFGFITVPGRRFYEVNFWFKEDGSFQSLEMDVWDLASAGE